MLTTPVTANKKLENGKVSGKGMGESTLIFSEN